VCVCACACVRCECRGMVTNCGRDGNCMYKYI